MTFAGLSVGVVYVKEGQTDENQFFSNENGSNDFMSFMDCIGDRITLRGWTLYTGSLDVERDLTGKHSYYTAEHGYEIMYHVSTLLPFNADDEQKLERKRHIGNDICVVVFVDGQRTPFVPLSINSHFNQVFCIVQVDRTRTDDVYYRVAFCYKDGVNIPAPPLADPPTFRRGPQFRQWLLMKLINAERAAYIGPGFGPLIQSVREEMLGSLCTTFRDLAQEV